MDAIGSEQFVFVKGDPNAPTYELESITRRAVSGVAYRELAQRAQSAELRAGRDYASAAAANAAIANYKAMVKSVVSITQYGQTRTGYLVLDVREIPDSRRDVLNSVGGVVDGPHWMETVWSVIYTG